MIGPVCLDRIPELLQSLFIGVAVLHDESGDALGMFQRQSPAHRSAVVHDVHGVALDAELIEQAVDQLGEAVERVGEFGPVRHVALAVARIVGCDHVIAVGKGGDEVAEHVRRGRKSVQQQDDRRICRPGLAIKDVHSIDFGRAMVRDTESA